MVILFCGRTETCAFSGFRIYPGHGVLYIRIDGKNFRFINGKNEASFHMKRNPRKLNWTLFYRRLRKKGTQEDQLKKAKKRVIISTAATRGIQGLSIQELNAKQNESADKRKAVKEASLRDVKEKKRKEAEEKKKKAPAAAAKAAAGSKASEKLGKAGGANIKPARISAPGKQSAR